MVAPAAGPGGGLTRIAIDTGEARQLTRITAPGESHWSPRFSPDGKKLAYMDVTGNFNNVVFAADASPDGALTSNPKRVGSRLWYSFCLDWFPDSEHILVPSIRGAELQYWKAPLNGAPEVRLPLEFPVEGTTGYGPGHVLQSTVSLRGARLAAVVFRQASDIQRLECESSAAACKAAPFYGSSRTDEELHVAPNGQWIAFASTRSGAREIWRARPDGPGAIQLPSMPEIRSGSPHWSPDSQWLAFDAPYLGRQAVYLVAAEGGTARRLTEGGPNMRPGFSADGKWVHFAGSDDCIWKMPAAGGQMQKVTRTRAASANESPDGRWLYFFSF